MIIEAALGADMILLNILNFSRSHRAFSVRPMRVLYLRDVPRRGEYNQTTNQIKILIAIYKKKNLTQIYKTYI